MTLFASLALLPSTAAAAAGRHQAHPRAHPATGLSLLFSFGSAAGTYNPVGKLVADAGGALYGTTQSGGISLGECALEGGFNGPGCGGVYKMTPNGSGGYTQSLIYEFQGAPDGALPYGELYVGANGALYGTTAEGGTATCNYGGTNYGCGTVFKLTPSGSTYTETVLYSFQGGTDGAFSSSGIVADADGALYGTTQNGGDTNSDGTIFKLSLKKGAYVEKVLHRFTGCLSASAPCDGANPWATPYLSPAGALYGTTLYGGSHQCVDGNLCGTVWRLVPKGKGKRYKESVIYNFQGGSDGEAPQGGVVGDASGVIYGTTASGGGANWKQCNNGSIIRGCGVVFKLTASGKHFTESVLYAFQGGYDSAVPMAGVALDGSGNLYGTTYFGGEPPSNGSGGCGTLFELTPGASSYSESVLDRLQGCRASSTDPAYPSAGLLLLNGVLYGASTHGGKFGVGSVFSYSV